MGENTREGAFIQINTVVCSISNTVCGMDESLMCMLFS